MKWGLEESLGGAVGFSPDNARLWVISSVDANALRLLEIEIATGRQTVIAEDSQYDLSGLLVHPRDHRLQGVRFVGDRLSNGRCSIRSCKPISTC